MEMYIPIDLVSARNYASTSRVCTALHLRTLRHVTTLPPVIHVDREVMTDMSWQRDLLQALPIGYILVDHSHGIVLIKSVLSIAQHKPIMMHVSDARFGT